MTHGFRSTLPTRVFWCLCVALRCQYGGYPRLVCLHVGDGRDADARRLDDVDGVDADARTNVARRGGGVPCHVGRDDGGDDAAVLGPNAGALPPGRWQDRRVAPRPPDRARWRRFLLRLDRVRSGSFSAWRRAGGDRDAAASAGARCTNCGWCNCPDGRLLPVHRQQGPSSCLLPGGAGTAWRHGLRIGFHCSFCCAGLMAILLVIGVMNIRAMVILAAVIAVERLAPASLRAVWVIGAVVGAGLFLIVRAA